MKKALSFLLALCMLLSLTGTFAFAESPVHLTMPSIHTEFESSVWMLFFSRNILRDFSRLHSCFSLHPVHMPTLRLCGSASALLACPAEVLWESPAYQRSCSRS